MKKILAVLIASVMMISMLAGLALADDYKIGLMISPLATREEYYRTAEMLVEEYGADKFVMDVYPEDPQNE